MFQIDIVKVLIDNGADINVIDRLGNGILFYPIMGAWGSVKNEPTTYPIAPPNLELLRYLIERGASVCLPTDEGNTPLHLAVQNGNVGRSICI